MYSFNSEHDWVLYPSLSSTVQNHEKAEEQDGRKEQIQPQPKPEPNP